MKGIVTEFNMTGESVVDVKAVCKKWNNKFGISIYASISDDSLKYTLLVKGRGQGYNVKTQISEAQALEIKEKLSLVTVKDSFFKRASLLVKQDFVDSEVERFKKILEDKQREYRSISDTLISYENAE
jgi:hypothetical protein